LRTRSQLGVGDEESDWWKLSKWFLWMVEREFGNGIGCFQEAVSKTNIKEEDHNIRKGGTEDGQGGEQGARGCKNGLVWDGKGM